MIKRVVTVAAGLVFVVSVGSGSFDDDVELIGFLAAQNEANRSRIVTWRGNATVEDVVISELKEPGTLRRRSTVDFVCDQGRSAVRWRWCVEGQSRSEGEPYQAPEYREKLHIGMKKDDKFYYYKKINENFPNSLFIRPGAKLEPIKRGHVFNPMWYYSPFHFDVVEHLQYIHRLARDRKILRWRVMRQADLVTVECDKDGIINRMVFDVSQGGLLVRYFGKDSGAEDTVEISWMKIKDTWLPASYIVRNVSKGTLQERKVSFRKNVVNEPVGAEEFTYEKLGLEPGDKIQDQLVGVTYRYKYDEAVEGLIDQGLSGPDASAKDSSAVVGAISGAESRDECYRGRDQGAESNGTSASAHGVIDSSSGHGRFRLLALGVFASVGVMVALYVWLRRVRQGD